MINILYTINFLTNGGPTRVLQNIIKGIDRNKYRITVLTLINENEPKIVKELRETGINVIEFKYSKNLLSVLKDKKKIISAINEVKPDIIHTHGIVSTFIVADKKIKCYKTTTIHNNMFEDYAYTYGKISGRIYAEVHILSLKRFDEIICCSKTSYEVLKNRVKNLSYIVNGVDVNKNVPEVRKTIRKELKIDEDALIYVYGGVINNRKRVVELVELYNDNLKPNEYLLIVGDGPLKAEAEKINNPNIKFLGFKTNIIDYFMASDVYTSFSSSEGFSISVIEALSCNLFCFLSDIPSHKECYEIDDKYYIGEYFNKESFKLKKELLLDNIKKHDKNKLSKFQETYLSSDSMVKQYEKKYEERG